MRVKATRRDKAKQQGNKISQGITRTLLALRLTEHREELIKLRTRTLVIDLSFSHTIPTVDLQVLSILLQPTEL
jgi:hypothetical protein